MLAYQIYQEQEKQSQCLFPLFKTTNPNIVNTIISTNHSIIGVQEDVKISAFYSDNGELIA